MGRKKKVSLSPEQAAEHQFETSANCLMMYGNASIGRAIQALCTIKSAEEMLRKLTNRDIRIRETLPDSKNNWSGDAYDIGNSVLWIAEDFGALPAATGGAL